MLKSYSSNKKCRLKLLVFVIVRLVIFPLNFQEIISRDISSDDEVDDEFQDARDEISPTHESTEYMSFDCSKQNKHMFVLSEAGKPIYVLHGDEDDHQIVAMCGVMQALVSYVADCDDSIRNNQIFSSGYP